MRIYLVETIHELVAICAELAREGIKFEARKDDFAKAWTITLTGGF